MVSEQELVNSGVSALISALTLTSADGPTARALVGEIERAAVRRLDTELALSRQAIAAGGPRATEEDILRTWADYYVAAIHTMTDIEVGGSSAETSAAIDAAAKRVAKAGGDRVASLSK